MSDLDHETLTIRYHNLRALCADQRAEITRLRRRLNDAIEEIDDLRTRLDFAHDEIADRAADERFGRAREYGDPLTDCRHDMPDRGVA